MTLVSLTYPVGEHADFKCGWLRHCKTFLSPNFHGRQARVLNKDANGVFICTPPVNNLEKVSWCIGALKIIGWLTVFLPLLALIGALIFHACNPLQWEQQQKISPNPSPRSIIQPVIIQPVISPMEHKLKTWSEKASKTAASPLESEKIIKQSEQIMLWINEAKDKNKAIFVKNYELFSRRMVVTPDEQVFKVLNKSNHGLGFTDQCIGKGSFKNVKLAEDFFTGERYATATMTLNEDDDDRMMGDRELSNLELLKDAPGFIHLKYHVDYESKKKLKDGSAKQKRRLILELGDVGNLSEVFNDQSKNQKFLSDADRHQYALQLLQSLAFLHGKQLIHRDLKARNVVLKTNANKSSNTALTKIIDLASVCHMTDTTSRSNHRTTHWYASPEYAAAYLPVSRIQKKIDVVKKKIENCTVKNSYKRKKESEKKDLYLELETVLAQNKQQIIDATTPAHEVWALGCLFYEMYRNGHTLPWIGAEVEAFEKLAKFDNTKIMIPEDPIMEELLSQIFNKDPAMRPTASQLLVFLEAKIATN